MDTTEVWSYQQPQCKGETSTITSAAFKPDGTKVVVCAGQRILVFKTADGKLLKSLKGHKANVYSVSFSRNGAQFASGGADNCTVIWSEEGKGIVKYSHSDSVQVVAFNPARDILASCSNSDFGLWTPKERSVAKYKLESKALSAAWTNDGQIVAIGMLSGIVSLRDLRGNEQVSIVRSAPAWCLDWCPCSVCADDADVLALGCWDRTLSFYQASGVQVNDEKQLDFFPCSLTYFNEKSLVVGGSNKAVSLFSSEGVDLCTLANTDNWVWAAEGNCNSSAFVLTDHSGFVSLNALRTPSVHIVCGDHIVWSESTVTELSVRHLASHQVDIIECDGVVEAACYLGSRLAIKLPHSILLYELLDPPGTRGKLYRQIDTISIRQCGDLIALLSTGIMICQGKKLELLDCNGISVQHWMFEANVEFIQVDGRSDGREGVLVGLENGDLYIIFGRSSFPTFVLSHTAAITKVAINAGRTHVAVIDDGNSLYLYELLSKEMLFREDSVTSVAFHDEEGTLLCYGGHGTISIRALQDTIYTRSIDGDITGFRGSRIFLYHKHAVESFDVSLSTLVLHLVELNRFDQAFNVACTGVTESVWGQLANEALDNLQFMVAREAFLRAEDYKFLELIDSTERQISELGGDNASLEKVEHTFKANVALIRHRYPEAATHFKKSGDVQTAIDLFVKLRMWEEAKSFANASGLDLSDVLLKHAAWAKEGGDWKVASELYLSAKEYSKAIALVGEAKEVGWGKSLLSIAQQLPASDVAALEQCGKYLAESVDEYAQEILEVYKMAGNLKRYMEVCVQTQNWSEAEAIYSDKENDFGACPSVLPYAEWLITQERFQEAFSVYHRADSITSGWRLVSELVSNAIVEERFKDASFYHLVLAREATREDCSVVAGASINKNYSDENHRCHSLMSQLYYAYHYVHDFCDESFCTRLHPETLLQLSAFLINNSYISLSRMTRAAVPEGVSLARVYFTFAKQARSLGAFQSARVAYERLRRLVVPADLAPLVDFDTLTIQGEPAEENPDHSPVCYRCGSTGSILREKEEINSDGVDFDARSGGGDGAVADSCANCGHPYVRCGINYDVLPLVEFVPGADVGAGHGSISDRDAVDMIASAAGQSARSEEKEDGENDDLFTEAINSSLARQESSGEYLPTEADEATLRSLDREEVFFFAPPDVGGSGGAKEGNSAEEERRGNRSGSVVRMGRGRYFKNAIPEIGIGACRHCHRFFHEQDFELAALENGGRCVLCRQPAEEYGHL